MGVTNGTYGVREGTCSYDVRTGGSTTYGRLDHEMVGEHECVLYGAWRKTSSSPIA